MSTTMEVAARSIFERVKQTVETGACGAVFVGLSLVDDGLWCVEYVDRSVGLCSCYAGTLEEIRGAVEQASAMNAMERAHNDERMAKAVKPSVRYGFSRTVKKRDGACVKCGSTDRLHAHHIKPKATHPDLRNDPANGITLCSECHVDAHRLVQNYG